MILPKLANLSKHKTADEIAWGNSGEDARFLSNLRRLLERTEERDRTLLMSLAQKVGEEAQRPEVDSRLNVDGGTDTLHASSNVVDFRSSNRVPRNITLTCEEKSWCLGALVSAARLVYVKLRSQP